MDKNICKPGYKLVFNEEFDGPSLDTDKWVGAYLASWSTAEKSAAKYRFEDSSIVLRIDQNDVPWCPEYDTNVRCTSIQSVSRDGLHVFNKELKNDHHENLFLGYTAQYGYFEVRAKVPKHNSDQEGHAAWWMIGLQNPPYQKGEVDMFEVLSSDAHKCNFNVFAWEDRGLETDWKQYIVDVDLAEDFHIYGFEWTQTHMKLYIDGKLIAEKEQSIQYKCGFLLGLYDYNYDKETGGVLDPNIKYPKEFYIDYFRAYQANNIEDDKSEEYMLEKNIEQYAYAGADSGSNIDYINSALKDIENRYISTNNRPLPQYIYLQWTTHQSFNNVVLNVCYCKDQAPTNWDIEVSENGIDNWKWIATSGDVEWLYNDSTIESKSIFFEQVHYIKGMRLKINKANLNWNHFSIINIEVNNI